MIRATQEDDEIDMRDIALNELINLRALRDSYEAKLISQHSEYSGSLKKLAVEYKEITFYFGKLEELVKLSIEGSEATHSIVTGVNQFLKDTHSAIKTLSEKDSVKDSARLISKIVVLFDNISPSQRLNMV